MTQEIEPTTVKQIQGLPDKALVYRFVGSVVSCYEQKAGESARGPWSIQNLILRDADGDSIKLMLKDKDAVNFPDGSPIELATYNGPKGHSGLYAEDDNYRDEVSRILKATKTCQITATSAAPPEQAPAEHPSQQPPPQQQQQAGPDYDTRGQEPPPGYGDHGRGLDDMPDQDWDETSSANNPANFPPQPEQRQAPAKKSATTDFQSARKKLVQIANLHLTCAIAVHRMEAPVYQAATGHDMTPEAMQAATASIYIKAERTGLVNDMPTSPLGPDDFA